MNTFRREFSLYFMYTFCLSYLSLCITFVYLHFATSIQPDRRVNTMSDIFSSVLGFFLVLNFLSILLNLRIHFIKRNFRIKGSTKNPMILYFICLPLLVLTVMALLYILIYDFFYIFCQRWPVVVVTTSMAAMFVATIILVLQTNGIRDTGESWILNFSNSSTILLTLITLVSICLFNVVMIHVFRFRDAQTFYFKELIFSSCTQNLFTNDTVPYLIHQTFRVVIIYYQVGIILLSVTIFPYFVTPLKRNIRALQRLLIEPDPELIPNNEGGEPSPGRQISSYDYISNVVWFALFFIANIILVFPSSQPSKDVALVIRMVELLLIIAWNTFMLSDSKFWKETPKTQELNVFSVSILYIGTFGELISTIVNTLGILGQLYAVSSVVYIPIQMIHNILEFIQIYLQNILLSFILQRKINKTNHIRIKKVFESFNPMLALAVLNAILFLNNILVYESLPSNNNHLWENLFIRGTFIFNHHLIILYRAFCVLIFIKLLYD